MLGVRKHALCFSRLLALAGGLVAAPGFADEGGCAQWDVGGSWGFVQSNSTGPSMGPGAKKIRDALAPGFEQSGFDDAVANHQTRIYHH